MKYRSALTEIYQDELRRCPFTNITPIWQFHGHEVLEQLGGTCVTQAKRLMDAVRTRIRELVCSFHGARPGELVRMNHAALIASSPDGSEQYLFEPSYLAAEPIPLQEVLTSPPRTFTATSATLPRGSGNAGGLHVQLNDPQGTDQSLYVTVDGRDGLPYSDYPLFLGQTVTLPEGNTPYIPGSGQVPMSLLEMTLVTERLNTCRITLATDQKALERLIIRHQPSGRTLDSHERTRKSMQSELDAIAATLDMKGRQLREFLYGGLELYHCTPELPWGEGSQ